MWVAAHKYAEVSGTHKCVYGAIATTRAVRINAYTAFKVLILTSDKVKFSDNPFPDDGMQLTSLTSEDPSFAILNQYAGGHDGEGEMVALILTSDKVAFSDNPFPGDNNEGGQVDCTESIKSDTSSAVTSNNKDVLQTAEPVNSHSTSGKRHPLSRNSLKDDLSRYYSPKRKKRAVVAPKHYD